MNSKTKKQNTIDIFLLHHSNIEKHVFQIQRKLIIYGQTKWNVHKNDENINYNAHYYEKRLNLLMRSSVLICLITRDFCECSTLKKELYIVEKSQKNKKVILIFYEKIPSFELFYQQSDLTPQHVFILDRVSLLQDENDENFQVLVNFLTKNEESQEQQLLLNENYYYNKFLNDNFKNNNKLLNVRPLTSLIKNVISPNFGTFKKQIELIQKKYENLLELYSLSYNFEQNLFTYDFVNTQDVLVKFEQIENEIDVLFKSDELNTGVSLNGISLPNQNLIFLMNLLKIFYNFKQFIIKNLIDADFIVIDQVEYKNNYLDVNMNLKRLYAKRDALFDQQINLLDKQVKLFDQSLVEDVLSVLEMELKNENLLNIYGDVFDFEKQIESKEADLERELTIKQMICTCFKNERIRTLEEKIGNLIKNKNFMMGNIEKNQMKIKTFYFLKQIKVLIENSRFQILEFYNQKEITGLYLKKLDKFQYGKKVKRGGGGGIVLFYFIFF
jgi:hypothetical protein